MSNRDKAQRLFEYIRQVFSVDLLVERDITSYSEDFWWQADILQSQRCKVRQFCNDDNASGSDIGDAWLTVTKYPYDNQPPLPSSLQHWIAITDNPTKRPVAKESIANEPVLNKTPAVEEAFKDDPARLITYNDYINRQWIPWAERVLPQYKANSLYDQLFSLRQRLNVEGDRLEIMWGHLFLSWCHSSDNKVYHPLILTPMNLNFDPDKRTITLTPGQTTPTKIDIDCLTDLSYPNKAELIDYLRAANSVSAGDNGNNGLDSWNNAAMKQIASKVTGLLSNAAALNVDLYEVTPAARPEIRDVPTIYNAPIVFVRKRTRRLWVDDAEKVVQAIKDGDDIPVIIRVLLGDRLPVSEVSKEADNAGDELLLALPYNDQQEEIVKRLTNHFGVLVQGPPGTGKSHTIANVISSLLARGKTILVTSQTENALKVLRDYLPGGIKSLCVSQLGNDIDSRKQLNEAIVEIGKHNDKQNSSITEESIQGILKKLSDLRSEQAQISRLLRQWREIESSSIIIDGETLTAIEAAKEYSGQCQECCWFVDILSPETEPPLTSQELIQMCSAIKEISPEDRLAVTQYLPQSNQILHPDDFEIEVSRLRGFELMASETQVLRDRWGQQLSMAKEENLNSALTLLDESLSTLSELTEPWQINIVELISTAESQDELWKELLAKLRNHFDTTRQSYKFTQGYKIEQTDVIPADMDVFAALAELKGLIWNEKNPSSWLTRLTMSKTARFVYDTVKVDGFPLKTIERIDAAKADFKYKQGLAKLNTLWEDAVTHVGAPRLNPSVFKQLTDVDVYIKKVTDVLKWKHIYHAKLKGSLQALGFKQQVFHRSETLKQCVKALSGQISEIERKKIDTFLSKQQTSYKLESLKDNAHRLWSSLAEAVKVQSIEEYHRFYSETMRLLDVRCQVEMLNGLSAKLKEVAPHWYHKLEARAKEIGAQAIDTNWQRAWRWRRLSEWLNALHRRETVEELQIRLKRVQWQEREKITELVTERAWQRLRIKEDSFRALTAWAGAMRRYGKGTGKNAQNYLAEAAKAMVDAIDAVPAWIMPLHKVVQSFPARAGIFDVVIIDEASQCDLRALPVLYRARKVLIVGDPEQISPSNIGIDRDKVNNLIQQYLSDVAYSNTTFSIDNSIYRICETIPSLSKILLTEHFRSIPELIAFNNALCPSYGGQLVPLRIPNPNDMLVPPIATVYVKNGFKTTNDINIPEAEALVERLVECCRCEQYGVGGKENRVRTMGVVSLLGESQAKHIYKLISSRLEETEIERRRIICGDAYAFQGDERDVMFLSLVAAPNAAFSALTKDSDLQRFNVATSRARDQVFLFHSIWLEDIKNPQCVRYRLLQHYLSPQRAQSESSLKDLERLAESQFELDVGTMIIEKGYKLIAQYKPFPNDFNYRIDIVVQGKDNRVAVECDGDRWQGPDRWEYDQRRQSQLQRAGWKFWRISGSTFYRSREKAMHGLWVFLDAEGIKKQEGGGSAPP